MRSDLQGDASSIRSGDEDVLLLWTAGVMNRCGRSEAGTDRAADAAADTLF